MNFVEIGGEIAICILDLRGDGRPCCTCSQGFVFTLLCWPENFWVVLGVEGSPNYKSS